MKPDPVKPAAAALSARTLRTADAAEWERTLPAELSVFGSLGFARVQEAHADMDARLLVISAGDRDLVAWPLLLRSVGELPFAESEWGYDATTPSFTGPILLPGGEEDPDQLTDATDLAEAELRRAEVVACFAHLNPWSAARRLLAPADVTHDREIVYVDTTLGDEELLGESFSHAARKNLRRSEREGVTVRVAETDADLAEFHRIYAQTMERRDALEVYRYGLNYFQSLRAELGERAHFLLAEHAGEVIAATLYVHDDTDVFSYLGGADHGFQRLRPTNAVVTTAIRWARDGGRRRLVLGAGYRPADGIMRFKASFSPLRADLSLYRHVIDPHAYERLTAAWSRSAGMEPRPGGFFPAYRAAIHHPPAP